MSAKIYAIDPIADELSKKAEQARLEREQRRAAEDGEWLITDIPDLSTMETPDTAYLMRNIISAASMGVFTGESGSGKSSILTSIAYAISVGEPWMGFETVKTPVLYLDRENNLNTARKRLDRLHSRTGPNFLYWGNWVSEAVHEISSTKVYEWVAAQPVKPLIIVDSFIAFHEGSENDAAEVRRTFDMGRALTALGATVIFVHHTGKAETSKQYRGSSDIKGSVDFAYKITSTLNGMYLDRVEMECFKFRDEVIEKLSMCYATGHFKSAEVGISKAADTYDKLTSLLQVNAGSTQGQFIELAGKMNIGKKAAREFLITGVLQGRIERTGNSRKEGFSHNLKDADTSLALDLEAA